MATALNLFLHDMPRLSVDIDVVFTDHSLWKLFNLRKLKARNAGLFSDQHDEPADGFRDL